MTREMDVDSVHLLQDLAKFYDSATEMVVSEAFGNAVDVAATELQIELNEDNDGKYIRFVNNGPPMSKQDFEDYHVIARSSKDYGKGLGWAGIGAKLYLGSWLESKIITESSDGITTLASVMFIKGKKASWDSIDPTGKFVGTSYKVYLKPEDYDILSKDITVTVLKYFNSAMRNGLNVIIQGKKLDYWKPDIIEAFNEEIKIKNRHLPFTLWTSNENIPDERCNIEYHVSGKAITTIKPKNLLSNVKPEFKKKFYVVVDALCISDQLGTNKHNFRTGIFTSKIQPEIEKKINQILKKLNYLQDPEEAKLLKSRFTNILQKILKENFPELNPESICGNMGRGGNSPGKGRRMMIGKKSESKNNIKNKRKNEIKRPRNRGGFSFITVVRPGDVRQGWIKIETNQVVVNYGHSVALEMEKSRDAHEYHTVRVISNELLKKLATKASGLTVDSALEKADKLFTLLIKELHIRKQNIWSLQEVRRDADGKFLSK